MSYNKLYSEKNIWVRDHCHITGKYRGSAHVCNANYNHHINGKFDQQHYTKRNEKIYDFYVREELSFYW